MAKTYRRSDEEAPAGKRQITLLGETQFVSFNEAVAAAATIQAQLLLGASREEAEQAAVFQLEQRRTCDRFILCP
jgi:hypothetical protein